MRTAATSSAGPHDPADLPPGERERLAARRDGEGALAHPGQRRERDVLALEHEVLVHLVGHRDEVVLDAELRDHLELGAREHLAGRVVRRVQQQHARARRDRARELVGIEGVLGCAQLHDAPLRAGERDARGVRVVVRLERDDVVARLAQREDATRRSLRSRRRSPAPRCRDRARARTSAAGGRRSRGAARGSRRPADTGCARRGWPPPRRRRPRAGRRCRGSPGRG